MRLYHLEHVYAKQTWAKYERKDLGIYSDLQKTREAIAFYQTLPGFSAYPKHFLVNEREVQTEHCPDEVWLVQVYLYDGDYEREEDWVMGVYASRSEAESAAERFRTVNEGFLRRMNERDTAEIIVDKCAVNYRLWAEGFDSGETE